MVEHGTRVVGSEATGLGPEVKEDGIGFPVAKGTDGSLVNAGNKESGGTNRVEAVNFDAIRRDVRDVVDGSGSAVQFGSDIMGCDVVRAL